MSLKLSDLIWGLALIILGIGVGGDVLRIWDFSVFFSGFWAFFIIIPCGVHIFENGIRRWSLLFIMSMDSDYGDVTSSYDIGGDRDGITHCSIS